MSVKDILAIATGFVLLGCTSCKAGITDSNVMEAETAYTIFGLSEEVEILVDNWGVSHIYAQSVEDAFYAQGFNAARDRLWQIDLWHRRGLGKLSEAFGPDYVEHDKAALHFLYRGDMPAEWAVYADGAQKKIEAFVRGVNAYIQLTEKDESLLPEEFKRGQYKPSLWQAEDVVRIRIHALVSNVANEVSRAKTICKYGMEADRLRSKLEPEHTTRIPDGLDVCSIPEDVLKLYNYAHLSLASLPPGHITPAAEQTAYLEQIARTQGSNAWVISPDKSATGRAVFAGDPHRLLDIPSSRYLVHMSAPGLDVVGAGEPFAPGISMGHNGKIAYGLTYFYSDQEDLYVYDINPDNPNQYRYGSDWEDFTVIKETIKVRGGEDHEVALRFTRHGPVIYTEENTNKAFGVRAAKLGAGGSPYLGSLRLMEASSWQDFKAAMRHWHVPTLNLMYADTNGAIGWTPTGLAPHRKEWDGLLPVPGDGRYEWDGFIPVSDLLGEKTPKRGWIATANHMNIPDDCEGPACTVGYEWAPSYRFDRIADVFSSYDKIPYDASGQLQIDEKLSFGGSIIEAVRGLVRRKTDELTPEAAEALSFFGAWDGSMNKQSPQAHFFMFWYKNHLAPAVFKALSSVRSNGEVPFSPDRKIVFDILEKAEFETGNASVMTRDQLLLDTLTTAYAEMQQKFGTDQKSWAWGNVHKLHLQPLMAPSADNKAITQCLPAQGVATGGNPWTVNLAITSSKDPSKVTAGASVRLVIDVGEWDNSRGTNMPGQSGNHDNAHYCDLYDAWQSGKGFPLLYSKDAIEKELDERITIKPHS